MKAIRLRCEQMENPLGIDCSPVRLSWICDSGIAQSAYEIEACCGTGEIWNSGKVASSRMNALFGQSLHSKERILWKVRLWDEQGEMGDWSETASFEMGILDPAEFVAQWINPEEKTDLEQLRPVSYLRKTVTLLEEPEGARAYITAHGVYEAWINGRRVGDFVLAPGTASYDKHMPYQTYDVTQLLRQGTNEIQVVLGDGWYRSYSGVDGDSNLFGTELALFFQLENQGQVVCVSDATWEATQEGPLREADLQQGEVYDARKEELTGWHGVTVRDIGYDGMVCSNSVPILEQEHFAGKLITTPNGETVIDYGQNLAGYIMFTLDAHEGQRIVLTHGEALDENGNFTAENFQDRKRHKGGGTQQRVVYICKEGRNVYHSKFTIWGFQYAKVETDIDMSTASFTSVAVYSRMEQTGYFICGNEMVNRLVHNSLWSQKSNFCDIPTDCPTRERAGWTGDVGVFVDTGLFLGDCYSILRKWLGECRLMQYEDGRVANIAPLNSKPSFFSGLLSGSTGWGDACILVPYALYQRYDDVRILEENYGMMKQWYAFLEGRARKKGIKRIFQKKRKYRDYIIETGIDYGEWCEPGVDSTAMMAKTPVDSATAYFAYSGCLLAEIAEVLGHPEDAEHYRRMAHGAACGFREAATDNGRITGERQAPYVRAVAFDLLAPEDARQAVEDLNDLVVSQGYHLNTGFLSTPYLCQVLADNGHVDTAYRLLLQEEAPGWLYEVKKGANTIWETWDGINEKGEVHASLNHYAYGAITGWLFGGICGIQLRNGRLRIQPHPSRELQYATGEYRSPMGRIVSSWKYEETAIHYVITIPPNLTAEVILPGGRKRTLQAGTHELYEPIAD